MLKSRNPAFKVQAFDDYAAEYGTYAAEAARSTTMTVEGTALKTGMLLLLVVGAATFSWMKLADAVAAGGIEGAIPWIAGGAIGGLILCLATCFKPAWAPYTSPVYAVCEGLFLGGLSAMVETIPMFQGVVFQAVLLTVAIAFCMLICYTTGIIKATEKFKAGVTAAIGGIMLVYLATWILGFFGIGIPFIHGTGIIGIGFCVFVVIVASLTLILDFDFIYQASLSGAPKPMEWYGAFGLLVTLVWLYLEVLDLLMRLAAIAGED